MYCKQKNNPKKIIIMKNFIVLATFALLCLGACQKDEVSPIGKKENITIEDNISNNHEENSDMNLKNYYLDIMGATSANNIPSMLFTTNIKYKNSYQHIKQEYDANFGKCSWTSYVIIASCIIKGNCSNCSYPVSYSKVNAVRSACIGNNSAAYGAQITRLRWYCNTYDYQKLSCNLESQTPSNRFVAVKLMLNHLYTKNSPFLVIGTSGTVGHYLIVHAINWISGGTGSIIYYTDCSMIGSTSSYNNNIKSMNFTTFLDRMVIAPNNYNMLFIYPN